MDSLAFQATNRKSPTGQRRYVTVLFSDVVGSSRLAERLEHEEFVGLMNQFREIAIAAIARHGGKVIGFEGDGVRAVFGHRGARENDGRRATEAALEVHEAIAQTSLCGASGGTKLEVHSGLHSGLASLLHEDVEADRLDVLGEVPNVAARLSDLAVAGELLVSAESLGPQALFFEVAPRRISIGGTSTRLEVLRILGRAPVELRMGSAARRAIAPFVGRDASLAILRAAAEAARNGTPSAILVSGEPGIGKTRLIDEFERRLDIDGFRILRGYCEGYLGAEPLQPFNHWMREVLGFRSGATADANEAAMASALDRLCAGRAAEFEPIARALLGTSSSSTEAPKPAQLVAAIQDLITLIAEEKPLVLVLDDWQWADDASRQALESLRGRRLPLLVVVMARPFNEDDHALVDALTLRLGPLDADEAATAIAARLPVVDPFLVEEIYRQSGGNPLFIEEICHAAAVGDVHQPRQRGAGAAWINAMVASRVERLPEAQAELLRVASVAGNTFDTWLLENLMSADDLPALLKSLMEEDFLIAGGPPGTLSFKHVFAREAVYGTVDSVQRKTLHLRVASALEAAVGNDGAFEWLESLTYHYDAAGLNEPAARFAEAAGDKALAAMALDRARAHYIAALRALDELAAFTKEQQLRWCGIAQKLGQTCVLDPLDVAQGFPLFERATALAEETGDVDTLARATYWLAYVNYARGRPKNAVRFGRAALEHALATGDERLAAQVRATLAQALASAGRYDEAMPLFVEAVESKRQQSRAGSRLAIGSAYTLARMAYTFGDLGRFDEAEAHFAEAFHLLGDNIHSVSASLHELQCAVRLWQGRWDAALESGQTGVEIATRCRSRYLVAMGRALSACAAWARDGSEASLLAISETTRWIELRGGAVSTSLNYGWLVEATMTLGRESEARRHAACLFMRARAHDRHGLAQGCRALARLAAANGTIGVARHYLAVADRAAAHRRSPREQAVNTLARADVMRAAGLTAESEQLREAAATAFAAMGMHWHRERAIEDITATGSPHRSRAPSA